MDAQGLNDMVWADIHVFEAARPRSTQKHLGPSELGDPCDRKMVFKIMKAGRTNLGAAKWAAIKGTALHSMMERVYGSNPQWILEKSLSIAGLTRGTSDAYYVPDRAVVDWKFSGDTTISEVLRNGPSITYRRQLHVYGMGWEDAGYRVDDVSLQFFPGSGKLRAGWSEPYDRSIAQDVLDRYENLVEVAGRVKAHPLEINLVEKDPSRLCQFCPFFGTLEQQEAGTACAGPLVVKTVKETLDS